ncbi:MAG TPA: hypothetical protein PKA63_02200 [Oligoflexia bacterium]|nr:hypothetical protein [Oligoflexia bacterium]HMP47463.1 hypothetical protein [Oligoflexia bacterium]
MLSGGERRFKLVRIERSGKEINLSNLGDPFNCRDKECRGEIRRELGKNVVTDHFNRQKCTTVMLDNGKPKIICGDYDFRMLKARELLRAPPIGGLPSADCTKTGT